MLILNMLMETVILSYFLDNIYVYLDLFVETTTATASGEAMSNSLLHLIFIQIC